MERFELLNSAAALRAGAAEHWESWTRVVAEFVAARTGTTPGAIVPWAVAGAVQATYLASLRSWSVDGTDPGVLMGQLDANLALVGPSLVTMVSTTQDVARRR